MIIVRFFRNRLVIRLERWASAICRMSTFILFLPLSPLYSFDS